MAQLDVTRLETLLRDWMAAQPGVADVAPGNRSRVHVKCAAPRWDLIDHREDAALPHNSKGLLRLLGWQEIGEKSSSG